MGSKQITCQIKDEHVDLDELENIEDQHDTKADAYRQLIKDGLAREDSSGRLLGDRVLTMLSASLMMTIVATIGVTLAYVDPVSASPLFAAAFIGWGIGLYISEGRDEQ